MGDAYGLGRDGVEAVLFMYEERGITIVTLSTGTRIVVRAPFCFYWISI